MLLAAAVLRVLYAVLPVLSSCVQFALGFHPFPGAGSLGPVGHTHCHLAIPGLTSDRKLLMGVI